MYPPPPSHGPHPSPGGQGLAHACTRLKSEHAANGVDGEGHVKADATGAKWWGSTPDLLTVPLRTPKPFWFTPQSGGKHHQSA